MVYPPGMAPYMGQGKNRGSYLKKTLQGCAHGRGVKMAENQKLLMEETPEKKEEKVEIKAQKTKKKANKITAARIKKEIDFLTPLFQGIDDERRRDLVNKIIEEAAFMRCVCFQAKEDMKSQGLTSETINGSQRFVKVNPSADLYNKYVKEYRATINSLIELLPPEEKKTVSRLAELRE